MKRNLHRPDTTSPPRSNRCALRLAYRNPRSTPDALRRDNLAFRGVVGDNYHARARVIVANQDGVLEGRIRNGFNGTEPDVAASLPYTTGAMMAAAEEVVLNGGFAYAPVSGFHHAHYDSAGGFCTFNGLIVTAVHLQRNGYAQRIGILDLDQHYGDGHRQTMLACADVYADG